MDRDATGNPGPLTSPGKQLTLFDEAAPDAAGGRRHILLGGRVLEYTFERRRRHTIGLRVCERGLAVAAPLRAPWREIEGFLHEKGRWIVAKLEQWAAAGAAPVIYGESGETVPVLGRTLELEVRVGAPAAARAGDRLQLSVPEPHRRPAVRTLLVTWLKSTALQQLQPRVAHYAARVSLPAPPVSLSAARAQWGVCMGDGRIRLAWRLVHLAPELADYVVAHEVAHLVELNHSERFWALVEWLYPHWQEAREAIERESAVIPRIEGV